MNQGVLKQQYLMSIIDDIEAILNIHQDYRSRARNWEPSQQRQLGLTVEQENKMVLQEYQALKNIAMRSCQVLIAAREQYEQRKEKGQELEQQLQASKQEIHNLQDQLEKLQERVAFFQREEESLKQEIAHLHHQLTEKQREVELKDERNGLDLTQLKEENAVLNQYIENICIKYKNLEIIAEQQARRREKLEEEITHFHKIEKDLLSEIGKLSSKVNEQSQLKTQLQKQLSSRIEKVQELQSMLYRNHDNAFQLEMDQYEIRSKDYQHQFNLEVPFQLKLLQLSDQISYNQKVCVNLNSSDHSFQGSNDIKPHRLSSKTKEKFNDLLLKVPSHDSSASPQHSLRKVASHTLLSHHKKQKQEKHLLLGHIKPLNLIKHQIAKSKASSSDKQENSFINKISNRASNRLKDIYKLNSDKIIIQTQVTDRQQETDRSNTNEEEIAIRSLAPLAESARLADPYYIHYLLSVQSIKIQEDQQGQFGILQIDMKPYYDQLVSSKISLSKWSDWIRTKLINISNQEQQA